MRCRQKRSRNLETGPLACPKCQGEMRIISFIGQREVSKKILQHLRRLYVQVKTANLYGDTTWYRRKVVEKTMAAGKGVVKLDITGINQVGTATTEDRAEVVLPTRAQ